jgi:hypothetical protein
VSRAGNNIASIVFIVALGLFVSQPILNASSEGPPSGGPPEEPVTTTTEAAAEPASTEVTQPGTTTTTEPAPVESPTAAPDGEAELIVDYPSRCLRAVPRPNPGLLATLEGKQASIATPTGAVTAQFRAKPPIQWSPSGEFLGSGGGDVFTASGEERGSLFTGDADLWAWSPKSDCAIGLVSGTLQFGTPGGNYGALLNSPVVDFAFSPNGRNLAIAMDDPEVPGTSMWIASLEGGVATRTQVLDTSAKLVVFGWDGRGRSPVWASAPGESVAATGMRIRYLGNKYGTHVLPFKDQFDICGSAPMVVGRARGSGGQSVLQVLPRKGLPRDVSPPDRSVIAGSCAPRGGFLAEVGGPVGESISARRLFLADGEGTALQDLTADTGYADDYPLWGPLGTGVAFVRRPLGGGPAQIWFVPEGGNSTATGLTATRIRGFRGHFAWSRVFDWSADRPTGTPTD